MSDYFSVQAHQSLVFDGLRNGFYSAAIKGAVKKDSIVLDLGSGLGIHGFMAALEGARTTYLVDPSPVTQIATMIAKANDLSAKVVCLEKKIQEVDLPEKADIIISVFTGNFLLAEDLLPSLFYARDKYLRPGGRLIPDRAIMEAVPVSASEYYEKNVGAWSRPLHQIDFTAVREFAANDLYFDQPKAMQSVFLAEPATILELDVMTADDAACRSRIEVKISKSGLCHGWLGWFQIRLGDQWLSTSPLKTQTHWSQVFLPLAQPVQVTAGEKISFELNRPEFGGWTWTVETDSTRQRQSSFLSEPLSPEALNRKSDDYTASLSVKGQAVQNILERLNGNETTSNIAEVIADLYPQLFPDQEYAKRFIIRLIESYC